MWEQLIRRIDRERLGIGFEHIESPFFAIDHVYKSLLNQGNLPGLNALKSEFGCYGRASPHLSARQIRDMLAAVEEGDWLLVLRKPFSPLSSDSSGRWSRITGLRVQDSYYIPPRVQKKPPLPPPEFIEVVRKTVPMEKQLACTFTKPCNLPDGAIDYSSYGGSIPTTTIGEYGKFALLGGRNVDAEGNIALHHINGNGLPTSLGTLLLGRTAAGATVAELATASASSSAASGARVLTASVASVTLTGLVALLWPSSLGDSSLYSDEQLKSLKEGRTRVRLHVEQQSDGTLKGYGYNTQKRSDWEMIPVVQFMAQGSHQVADFGNGTTLIWTPSADPSKHSGIPPLQGAPQAPQIWIYPPTEQADRIIVDPIYPPDYNDFILVFPAESGIKPLYIVLNVPGGRGYHVAPDVLTAFPDAVSVRPKSTVQGGGKKRDRWKDNKGRIYEWDFQHGAVEIYDKQGKHLGEFDAETGEQNKPAKPGRTTPK